MARPAGYDKWDRDRKSKYWARKRRIRAAREKAKDDPSRVTQPLTPRLRDREMRSAERLQFGDEQRALQGQAAVSQHMQATIPAWFQAYQNQIQQSAAQSAGFYQQAGDQQQALHGQLQQSSLAQNQALAQQEQASARARGAQVDPSLARTAQQASDARAASSAGQIGLTRTLGANAGTFLSNVNVAAGAQRLQAQQEEANRGRAVGREQQDLARRQGDFRVAYRRQAREDERRYGLEQQAFGLDVAKAQDDARADRSKARARTRSERARQRDKDEDQALAREKFEDGGSDSNKPKQPGTRENRASAKRTFRTALAKAKRQSPRPGEGRELASALMDQKVVKDPLLARAVAETAIYGGVSRKTRERVYREYGIYLRQSTNRSRSRTRVETETNRAKRLF